MEACPGRSTWDGAACRRPRLAGHEDGSPSVSATRTGPPSGHSAAGDSSAHGDSPDRDSPARYSAARYSAARYSAARYSAAYNCSTGGDSAARDSPARHGSAGGRRGDKDGTARILLRPRGGSRDGAYGPND